MQKSTQLAPVVKPSGKGKATHGGAAISTEKQYTTLGLLRELGREIAVLENKGSLSPEEVATLELLKKRLTATQTAVQEQRDVMIVCEHTSGGSHTIPVPRLVAKPDTRFCIPHQPSTGIGQRSRRGGRHHTRR
ncbi:hypothetical protein COX05_00995 [candidate division WWE3 bacterium CG22_combo_CG10-13_8_21_14_all_39_12]|uniref:Uncharacterized protein n=1 Tax=candidate division WWE3 bacterium CG22_combo_CG10-13_8_21_14_all_39_12 TaxID=1975094 RepID=A0A2H0BGM7_UNCKA|nr:MAG: hypothetical protein COX05_00995 [candidate division WWE3 bacterium CG22_combo_CG10-13_8_21_14_all_39_12]